MKFTGKAGALAVATKAAAGALNAKSSIPILHDVLIDAADDLVRCTGTDLNFFVTATCDADVSDCGNAAVPGESLSALLAGLERDADVTIASDDRSVTINAGRGRYRLAALPPDTFPHVAEADTTAELALSSDDVQGLFGTTAFCIDRKKNRRLYLQGCYLHADGERLACCATDGYERADFACAIAV
jgi:DNA polymerase-3 subunit beta